MGRVNLTEYAGLVNEQALRTTATAKSPTDSLTEAKGPEHRRSLASHSYPSFRKLVQGFGYRPFSLPPSFIRRQ